MRKGLQHANAASVGRWSGFAHFQDKVPYTQLPELRSARYKLRSISHRRQIFRECVRHEITSDASVMFL